MEKMTLERVIINLTNMADWASQEKGLPDLNQEEIDTLKNALVYLDGINELFRKKD